MINNPVLGTLLLLSVASLAPDQQATTTAASRIELGRLANGAAVTFVRVDTGD